MGYFVYIIYSESYDVFYKGFSERPYERLQEHNDNLSKFTAGKGPWTLVYLKCFNSKKEALIAEKKLKRCNRDYIKWKIDQSENSINK
jgi:putative endonuclease